MRPTVTALGTQQTRPSWSRWPFKEDEPDPDLWLKSFSGPNLRWEALGILFTYWALGEASLTTHRAEVDGHLPGDNPAKPNLHSLRDCTRLCIEICNNSRNCKGNTLLLYLTYKFTILESVTAGDASMFFPGIG
jgi:hypothetical protein